MADKEKDLWAVWPDSSDCPLSEVETFQEMLQFKSDDYVIKEALGYDITGCPIYEADQLRTSNGLVL